MNDKIDKFYDFKTDFADLFEKSIHIKKDNSKYHFSVSAKLINIFNEHFTAQFIITNLSDEPYSIEEFDLYYKNSDKPIKKLKPEIAANSFSIVYLRKNEAYSFAEKFLKEEQRNRFEGATVELTISGHDPLTNLDQ